jgi:kumamolisin
MITVDKNLNDQITISLYLARDVHENGMTLTEYANAVLEGFHPVLDHDSFVYQFGTTDENFQKVINWVSVNNLSIYECCKAQSVVKVTGSVGTFNRIFKIILKNVTDENRTYMISDVAPAIPVEMLGMIENVLGFDESFTAVNHAVHVDSLENKIASPLFTNAPVTPIQMAKAYKVPAGDGNGVCIAILEFTYSGYVTGYNSADVTRSFSRIGLEAPTIVNISVNGATVSSTSDGESMLDIYCAGGIAPKAKIAYYTAPNIGVQSFIDGINAAANDTVNNPCVISISWGLFDGTQYNSVLQTCVAKGITVFASSGDNGAQNLSLPESLYSQYLISTGGTSIFLDANDNILSEVAWDGSGGGISSSVSRPNWQDGLTTTKVTAAGSESPVSLPRRGIPDISAPADGNTGYQFYVNNSLSQYGGTSASAPLLAGIWARLAGLLGSRIPFNMSTWYSNPSLFNDITSGDNRRGYSAGYMTTAGWDPVTGLGSPKVDQIYQYFYIVQRPNKGLTFPKRNYGTRPSAGRVFPRIKIRV